MNKTLRNKTLSGLLGAASLGLMLVSPAAIADTLDFSSFADYAQGNPVMVLSNATITSYGTDIFVRAANIGKEICAYNASVNNCQADMRIDFNSAVSSLSFVTFGWDPGDFIVIAVYNGATLLGVDPQQSNGLVDLTPYSSITSIFIHDSSTGGGGMAYDGFNFTTTPIPEPETYAMLLAGLGLLGFAARRRKQKEAALA